MTSIAASTPLKSIKPVADLPLELIDCGRVAAGLPLEAIADEQRSELLELLTRPGRYALQVGDDSMCEIGIFSGDIVVVQSQQQACNGDIVVALIDNEQVVLKRIRHRRNRQVQLLADHPSAGDLILDASRVQIQGKVIGQVRCYR